MRMHTLLVLYWAIVSFVFGAIVGSFLNVVIVRLPREESIVSPRSRCPQCGSPIRPYDNVPILSYFLLGGRCRICGRKIPVRYLVVELVTALIFVALYFKWGVTPALGVFIVFCAAMIAVFWIDLEHMIIPDAISLNFLPVGIAAAVTGSIPGVSWFYSFIGVALGGVLLYIPARIYEQIRGVEGLGGGDVKLLAMIGAFLGPYGVIFVLFVSSTLGSLVGLAGMLIGRTGSTTPIPFGPFLSIAAVLYVLVGQQLTTRFLALTPFL